jgi:hypothetical protein
VSVSFVHGFRTFAHDGQGRLVLLDGRALAWLAEHEPVATAGPSIWIYRITGAAARATAAPSASTGP